jgi:23S rRNA pseudouridine2605 synthase
MAAERLQKVLAAAGVASRRASEALIAAGRVTVDGHVATIGEQADPASSVILVDGRPLPGAVAHVYLALHKPAGVASTVSDRHAATTVLDLVPTALVPDGARLYPVGRLDQDSEGLLLLTNDGEWADRVLHPRFGVEREYAVAVARPLDTRQIEQLRRGINLDEGVARLAQPLRAQTAIETRRLAAVLDPRPAPVTWYRAILAQGWKRQLRRMFGAVRAPIERLVRVRVGSARLDDLRTGQIRRLKPAEVRDLGAGRTQPSGRVCRPGRSRGASGGRPGQHTAVPGSMRRSGPMQSRAGRARPGGS